MVTLNELVKSQETPKKRAIGSRDVKKFTKEEEGAFAKELKRLNDIAETTNKIILYVILILSVMVATMLLMVWSMVIDASNRKTDSSNQLIQSISNLSSKIDLSISKKQ